jgi:hypothetical protein
MKKLLFPSLVFLTSFGVRGANLFTEVESFDRREGWGMDWQAMDNIGMAASVCVKRETTPRNVYAEYFENLKVLMSEGVGIAVAEI